MVILDEHGESWEVGNSDPAYPAVSYLARMGYQHIALPLTILIHGRRLPEYPWPSVDELERLRVADPEGERFTFYFALWEQARVLEQTEQFW